MLSDWHHTLLSYITRSIDCIAAGGEKPYLDSGVLIFYHPFQFTKEIHKALKNLNKHYLDKEALHHGTPGLSMCDVLIFNEVMSLAPLGHDMSKYPKILDWINKLASSNPCLIKANRPIEKLCLENKVPYFLSIPKL